MKTHNSGWFIILTASFFILTGCKKEANVPNTLPNTAPNTAPIAYSGQDITIVLPDNNTILQGSAFDYENNIQGYRWTKINGPNSYTLEDKNALQTKFSNQ